MLYWTSPQYHFNPCLARLLSVWSVLRYLNDNYLNHTQEMFHKEDWGRIGTKRKIEGGENSNPRVRSEDPGSQTFPSACLLEPRRSMGSGQIYRFVSTLKGKWVQTWAIVAEAQFSPPPGGGVTEECLDLGPDDYRVKRQDWCLLTAGFCRVGPAVLRNPNRLLFTFSSWERKVCLIWGKRPERNCLLLWGGTGAATRGHWVLSRSDSRENLTEVG